MIRTNCVLWCVSFLFLLSYVQSAGNDQTHLSKEDIQKMRVKELKQFLKSRGVECTDCVEKRHLIQKVIESLDLPILEETKPLKNKEEEKAEENDEQGGEKDGEKDGVSEDEQEESGLCPMCTKTMPMSQLQEHAATCQGEDSQSPRRSDAGKVKRHNARKRGKDSDEEDPLPADEVPGEGDDEEREAQLLQAGANMGDCPLCTRSFHLDILQQHCATCGEEPQQEEVDIVEPRSTRARPI